MRTRRNGEGVPPHARPFECLRVSGPTQGNQEGLPLRGRGWIPALGGRNDGREGRGSTQTWTKRCATAS